MLLGSRSSESCIACVEKPYMHSLFLFVCKWGHFKMFIYLFIRGDPRKIKQTGQAYMYVKCQNRTNETYIVRHKRQTTATVGSKVLMIILGDTCQQLLLHCLNDFRSVFLRKTLSFSSSSIYEKCQPNISSGFWNLTSSGYHL